VIALLACAVEPPAVVDSAPADTAPTCAWTGPAATEPEAAPVLQLPAPPRNVVLISIDTLRTDHLGRGDTPTLDSLLDAGVRATNHRSCSNWTLHSMGCALSGAYGLETGFLPPLAPLGDGDVSLPAYEAEAPLLAERLAELGFSTALASGNPFLSGHYGFERGFNVLESGRYTADEVTAFALEGLDALDDHKPFFLHAHYLDPHDPYAPPDAYLAELEDLEPLGEYQFDSYVGVKQLEDDWDTLDDDEQTLALNHLDVRYRGELRFVDDQIALLLAGLEERGGVDDTLFVFLSDHGEQFFDHGGWGHGEGLYAEETLALFGASGADLAAATWDGPTTHADLVPTVMAALGVDVQTSGAVLGTAGVRARFATKSAPNATVQVLDRDGWRLIYDWSAGTLELYERSSDPTEQVDRASDEAERLAELWDALRPAVERLECLEPTLTAVEPSL